MFNFNEYAGQASKARQHLKKACIACAEMFSSEPFKDCAVKMTTPTKLAGFLSWQYEVMGLNGDRWAFVKDAMQSFNIKYKRKYQE